MHWCARQLSLAWVFLAVGSSFSFGQVVAVSNFAETGRSLQRSRMTTYNDQLYFSVGINDTNVRELWRFDGTEIGVVQGDFVGDSEISLDEFTEFKGNLYFTADRGTHGQELYRFDGNEVTLAADISPGISSSSPVGLYVHNNELFFSAQEGGSFNNLWKYDGTAATRVATFNDPRASVVTGGSYNNELYFGADDGTSGMELWKYDGSGVSQVADINLGSGDSFPRDFVVAEDKMYFKATTPENGQEIWQYDRNGAALLVDTNPGAFSSDPGYLTVVGDDLLFSGVAWAKRFLFRANDGVVTKIMDGGGPVDIGTGELATIHGRRINGVEFNDLYLLDGSFYRTTVPSAGPFETLGQELYFGCACEEGELYRLAKPGDADGDGAVTFADFLTLSQNYGTSGAWIDGDFTNDGMVTFGDFLDMSENFGADAAIVRRVQPIPEPSSHLFALLGIVILFARRRSR